MSLLEGQSAPDVQVFRVTGEPLQLASYWQHRPVVLTFLRHFGCQFCREFLAQLRAAYPAFVERGALVVAVAQGNPLQAQHYVNMFRIPYPVVADPARQAYRAYGLGDSTLRETIGPDVLRHLAGAALRGTMPGVAEHARALTGSDGSSLRQVGGTFVIERGGLLRYIHIATPIYRTPAISDLLDILDLSSLLSESTCPDV